jgi:peptidase M23-like protein
MKKLALVVLAGLVVIVGLQLVAALTMTVRVAADCRDQQLDTLGTPIAAPAGGVRAELERLRFADHYPTLTSEQVHNAIVIAQVAHELNVPRRGLEIAIAAAIQESKLINLAGGDADSAGLFQQRPSQGWGTWAQVTDPRLAAEAFFGRAEHTTNTGLLDVPGWQAMPLTVAAQTVQGSAYPDAYAPWEPVAADITDLLGGDLPDLDTATSMVGVDCEQSEAGTCPPTGSPAERGLTADARLVLRSVDARFGSHTYLGVGERSANPDSDHPSGRAVDIMIDDWLHRAGVDHGTAVAQWVRDHARELGVTYVIWRARIWSAGDQGWRPYQHPSEASDPTSLHLDHVHVSVEGTSGTGACAAAPGQVVYPVPDRYIGTDAHNWHDTGSAWSQWHTGTDFSVPCGTPVLAAHAGTVEIDTTQTWAGPALVKVTTGPDSLTTWYAHLQTVTVSRGQHVSAGQVIGAAGEEGNTSGCHLHVEVHTQGGDIYGPDNVDPSAWLAETAG